MQSECAHGPGDGVSEQQAVGLGGEGGVAHPVGRRRLCPVQQVLQADGRESGCCNYHAEHRGYLHGEWNCKASLSRSDVQSMLTKSGGGAGRDEGRPRTHESLTSCAHLFDAAVGRSGRLAVGAEGESKRPAGDLHGMHAAIRFIVEGTCRTDVSSTLLVQFEHLDREQRLRNSGKLEDSLEVYDGAGISSVEP